MDNSEELFEPTDAEFVLMIIITTLYLVFVVWPITAIAYLSSHNPWRSPRVGKGLQRFWCWLRWSINGITNVMIALSVISAAVLTAVAMDPSIRYWVVSNVTNQHWFEILQGWWQSTTPAQTLESLKP